MYTTLQLYSHGYLHVVSDSLGTMADFIRTASRLNSPETADLLSLRSMDISG